MVRTEFLSLQSQVNFILSSGFEISKKCIFIPCILKINLPHAFFILYVVHACALRHMCGGASLIPLCRFQRDQTQAIRRGGKCLCPLTHHDSPILDPYLNVGSDTVGMLRPAYQEWTAIEKMVCSSLTEGPCEAIWSHMAGCQPVSSQREWEEKEGRNVHCGFPLEGRSKAEQAGSAG